MGSGDALANGSEVDPRGGGTRGKWELGDGIEGRRALPSAVKFTLEIERTTSRIFIATRSG